MNISYCFKNITDCLPRRRTEEARKLQEQETKFAEFAREKALKFQELHEHNRLLTEAATERARKLQEREAELTNALTVMSGRLTRLSEHNRWLAETMMDGGTEHVLLSRAEIQRLQDIEEGPHNVAAAQNAANETKPQFDGVRLQRPMSMLIDHVAANHPNLQGRDRRSRYLFSQKRVLVVTPGLARGGEERQILATADGLLQRGYEVEVFYVTHLAGEPNFIDEFSQDRKSVV